MFQHVPIEQPERVFDLAVTKVMVNLKTLFEQSRYFGRGGNVGFVTWPRGYKYFFMLISVEYEILNAHKYKKYGEIRLF